MTERLSLEGLRYARAVAESGSFSAAAREHGVTQPTLSNGVAGLEDYLGETLFVRSSRGVSPTPFGELLLPVIERALSALDTIDVEANRWCPPVRESIRMGVSPLISQHLIARAYGAVRTETSASRQLVLSEANLTDLRDALIADELDLIIIPSVDPLPRYEHRVIAAEPLVLVDSTGAAGDPVELPDVGDRQLIILPDTCGLTTFTRDLLRAHDLPLRLYPGEASSYRVLEEWSNLGLGSALLPQSKVSDPTTVSRTVLEDGATVEIFYEVVWNPRSVLAPDLLRIADDLTED